MTLFRFSQFRASQSRFSQSRASQSRRSHRGLHPASFAAAFALVSLLYPGALPAQLTAPAPTAAEVAPAPAADVQPSQTLGPDDLVQIMIPYCPELSHSFRISSDGTLALPLLKQPVAVNGLRPVQVERRLADALVAAGILTDPVVNVSVLEYRSKPVSVVGAVAHPLTFQATGDTTLLDALARAGGLTALVGPTITVTHHTELADGTMHVTVQSIPVRGLMENADPKLNVKLTGDEEVRVPEAGRIFVAGNVRKPGSFVMQQAADTTVIKALAMSEGLQAYSTREAWIYREHGVGIPREEIAVPLHAIMARKAPDVVLQPDDILYIPEDGGKRLTAKVLAGMVGFGTTAGAGLLVYR